MLSHVARQLYGRSVLDQTDSSTGGSETMAEGPSAASESRNHAKVRIRNDCRVFFVFALSSIEAARVVVEAAIATVDHADSRASEPPNRNPSGAASD